MKPERFQILDSEGAVRGIYLLLDRETGVHYLFAKFGSAGGLTPLLDAEGKPVVTAPERSEQG